MDSEAGESADHVARHLSALWEKYTDGDQMALLRAIFVCALWRRPMPEWVAKDYVMKFGLILDYRAKSLDEAFGAPFPKSTQLKRHKKYIEHRIEILEQVIRRSAAGQPIDEGMFEQIGENLTPPLGKTAVNEIYYRLQKELDYKE